MNYETIVNQIVQGIWEGKDVEFKFLESLQRSSYLEYLTAYSEAQLAQFEVYKLRDVDAGFAITKDKEIVSVHNNSGISGVGKYLVQKAIELGGRKVFHFDGWLTGFYVQLGFVEDVAQRIMWDEQYAPLNWQYVPIDIDNPLVSVYANEFLSNMHNLDEVQAARKRYSQGKPDLITRYVKR